jgi:hypothetical protein
MPEFGFHPLHGVHQPTTGTPPRQPGSVRRTTSIDMTRDPGSLDPVYLVGRGRDLRTRDDGTAEDLGTAGFRATVEMVARVVKSVESTPAMPGASQLVGAPAMSGFRAAVDAAAPELRARRDLLYTLLDDIPVATLISGHALSASGVLSNTGASGYLPVANQCAGFVTGGLLMNSFESGDQAVVTGPVAPDLGDPGDPDSWHHMPALPLHGMRRRRRLDVYPTADPRCVGVDAMFRDTYVRADGVETIIHEYTLTAAVDRATLTISEADAVARVLPWQECPGAIASARRINGMTLPELHFRVRKELTGIMSCTHLNDFLRSIADAAALLADVGSS